MSGQMVTRFHPLEDGWVIRNYAYDSKTVWTLLHDHHGPGLDRYGRVHSYMKLGNYKCNMCGALAPTRVNGFYELCKWSNQ